MANKQTKRNLRITQRMLSESLPDIAKTLKPKITVARLNQICVSTVGSLRMTYTDIPPDAVFGIKKMRDYQDVIKAAIKTELARL